MTLFTPVLLPSMKIYAGPIEATIFGYHVSASVPDQHENRLDLGTGNATLSGISFLNFPNSAEAIFIIM